MREKHILLADPDAGTLDEFRQALGQQCTITGVTTGAEALEELKTKAYDGVVASLHLPDVETGQLFNRVRSKYPKLVRFIIATENDRQRVVKEVLGAHQFLIRPFDADGLRSIFERALAFDLWIENEKLRKLVARMRTLPTVPTLYLELIAALKSPDSSTAEVGALIAKDMAVMTKLLQVINSAYFGLPRTVTSAEEAVGLLGFETVKSMVMAIKLLNQYDRLKTGDFSIEQLWQHSTAVAHGARQIVLLQTGERAMAEEAFAAGLLHDVGKAVLAGNFTDQYHGAQSLARKQQIAMCEVEREIFGASHGEVGAYLLGLWGMPLDILEAAALHHQPSRAVNKTFTVLTAVHVADVLQHHTAPEANSELAPKIDMEYLEEIGVIQCLPDWCEEILGPEAAGGYLKSEQPKPSESLPGPTLTSAPPPASTILPPNGSDSPCATHNLESEQTESTCAMPVAENCEASPDACAAGSVSAPHETGETPPFAAPDFGVPSNVPATRRSHWLVTASVAVVMVLVIWLVSGRHGDKTRASLIVKAEQLKPAPVSIAPEAQKVPAPPSQESVAEPSIQNHGLSNIAEPPSTGPAAAPMLDSTSATPTMPSTIDSPVPEKPKAPSFPELKLQGILFSPKRPSAIINGALMHANERILGVRIVEIRSASVVIEYRNQRKTLSLD